MKNNIKFVHIGLRGVNLNRVFKECGKQNISLFNIDRKEKGFEKLKNSFVLRFGILIGAFLFVILNILSSFFVWNIKVYGNSRIPTKNILAVLESEGIKKGSFKNTKNVETLESSLLNSIEDISLCSVVFKGTTVIVNIKEKLFVEEIDGTGESDDIVATENCTITELVVVNGTAQKKVGDSVKKGETIVAGFVLDASGGKIPCKANATIKAKTWRTATEEYQKTIVVATRTGNVCTQRYMSFLGLNILIANQTNNFENFEEEVTETLLPNNFLPMKITTKTFFETTLSQKDQNFDADKQSVLQRTQSEAMQKVGKSEQISNVFDVIEETADAFVVTSYVEVLIEL